MDYRVVRIGIKPTDNGPDNNDPNINGDAEREKIIYAPGMRGHVVFLSF